jgi:hypothetical protein
MGPREIGWGGMDWIDLAEDRHQCRALMNRVMNLRVSVLHVVHTGSGVHPTSYPMGTGDSFPGGKAAGE